MKTCLALIFDTDGFVPRWDCGAWTRLHGWTHIISDGAIFGAYFAIPVALSFFVLKRKDVPFPPIFWLFGAFILACGTGHLIEASLFWSPWYRLSATVKVFTALVSWATVIALIRVLPKALELPGMAKVTASLAQEVEERRRIESDLRRAGAFESAILNASLDAVITIDAEGVVIVWNHAAERIFGYSAREAIGRRMESLIIPIALREQHRAGLGRLAEGLTERILDRVLEMPAVRKDGTELIVELFITRISAEGPARFTGFVRDITERKQNEVRHRRAEERIRTTFEAAPNAMLIVDSRGRMTLVNSQAERLFGYRREELLDHPIEMLVPERYRGAHPAHRAHFFGAPTTRPMGAGRDLYGRRKDGSEVPIEIGLNPVRMEEGNFVLASIIDITERKLIEAQRQAALAEAETLLKEVHHRVKNNMQVISSLLRLHAGKLRDPVQRAVFDDCRDRIRSMSLIHERLYSAGQFAHVEFGGYLSEMVRTILGANAESAARVRLDLQFEPVEINLDTAVPLSLIASELVMNALKHGFANGHSGTLVMRLRSGEPMNELIVKDDGEGFSPDVASRESQGIGLGLVESLTRQIRGEREFRFAESGATVIIRWPTASPTSANPTAAHTATTTLERHGDPNPHR